MSVYLQAAFDEIFGQMIAGALPLVGNDAEASVALVARDILGTEDVHTVSVRDPDARRIYYFAAPSRALASVADTALPLTAAFPSHPAHRGPGAYMLQQGDRCAVAICNAGQLRLLFNQSEIIDETIAELNLERYDVVEVTNGYPLTSSYAALQQRVDTTSERVTRIAGITTLVMGGLYLAASAATGFFETRIVSIEGSREIALRRAVEDLSLVSPLSEQITMLQRVSSNTVKTGGWVERYRMTGRREAFEVLVPEWVTRVIVLAYGREARAELAGDGLVRVRRGKITGAGDKARVAEAPAEPKSGVQR